MKFILKKRKKLWKKPFLLSYLNSENKSNIFVGISNNNKKYEGERNDFGIKLIIWVIKRKLKQKRFLIMKILLRLIKMIYMHLYLKRVIFN